MYANIAKNKEHLLKELESRQMEWSHIARKIEETLAEGARRHLRERQDDLEELVNMSKLYTRQSKEAHERLVRWSEMQEITFRQSMKDVIDSSIPYAEASLEAVVKSFRNEVQTMLEEQSFEVEQHRRAHSDRHDAVLKQVERAASSWIASYETQLSFNTQHLQTQSLHLQSMSASSHDIESSLSRASSASEKLQHLLLEEARGIEKTREENERSVLVMAAATKLLNTTTIEYRRSISAHKLGILDAATSSLSLLARHLLPSFSDWWVHKGVTSIDSHLREFTLNTP